MAERVQQRAPRAEEGLSGPLLHRDSARGQVRRRRRRRCSPCRTRRYPPTRRQRSWCDARRPRNALSSGGSTTSRTSVPAPTRPSRWTPRLREAGSSMFGRCGADRVLLPRCHVDQQDVRHTVRVDPRTELRVVDVVALRRGPRRDRGRLRRALTVGLTLLLATTRALQILGATAALSCCVATAVSWRASTYDEPVVGRGWIALRSLSLTIALSTLAGVALLLVARRSQRPRSHRPAEVGAG